MALAVGGEFEAVGVLEYSLLLQKGLHADHNIIDVGCGSGRLAFQLRDYLVGQYVGIDVVPELYRYAQEICKRPDWRFYTAPGLAIPEPDGWADFICFFSVFTHLRHEESYKYLEDARRVIKPGGKIIFSFLEFAMPSHWTIFQDAMANQLPDSVVYQFMSRDAIEAWAAHLQLRVIEIADADEPSIKLDRAIRLENGNEIEERGNLGQSYCVLTR
jgi:ubiquinone/menaquinone biosynthesis C-methylase UbiE